MKIRFLLALCAAALLSACGTNLKVLPYDAKSGTLPVKGRTAVTTNINKSFDLATTKAMAVASGGGGPHWLADEIRHLGYFEEVVTIGDLEKIVIKNNLQDKVSTTDNLLGLNRFYSAYKPFLWVALYTKEGKMHLSVTDPKSTEEVFDASVKLDYAWEGVWDHNSRYPLYNAFLAWFRANSKAIN